MKKLLQILLAVAILAESGEAKGAARKKKDKERKLNNANTSRFKVLFDQAKQSTECQGLAVEELHSQCASYKISPECFSEHYGAAGLEFGEEDS